MRKPLFYTSNQLPLDMVLGLRITTKHDLNVQHAILPEQLVVSFYVENVPTSKTGRPDFFSNAFIRGQIKGTATRFAGAIRFDLPSTHHSATMDWETGFRLSKGEGIAGLMIYKAYEALHVRFPSVKLVFDYKQNRHVGIPIEQKLTELREKIRRNIMIANKLKKRTKTPEKTKPSSRIQPKKAQRTLRIRGKR